MLVEVEENGCVLTRTKSYLLALLLGAWVLSTEWLTACEQQGAWVEEADFLVKVGLGLGLHGLCCMALLRADVASLPGSRMRLTQFTMACPPCPPCVAAG